jgi:hypothetical protein
MEHTEKAVKASTKIPFLDFEATRLAKLKSTTAPDVRASITNQYIKKIEQRHECSVIPDHKKGKLEFVSRSADTESLKQLYVLLRILPVQTVTESSPEHTVLTALTKVLCDPPQTDESVSINIDLIAVYLAVLAQAVKNTQPSMPGTYDRTHLTDLTVDAFSRALQRESTDRPNRQDVQGTALRQLSVTAEETAALVNELYPVLEKIRDKTSNAQHRQAAAGIIDQADTNMRAITRDQSTLDRNW